MLGLPGTKADKTSGWVTTSSNVQCQECSDKECRFEEVLVETLNEMKRRAILSCLDVEGLSLAPTQQRRPWDRSTKARVHHHRTPETFSLFRSPPPSWFGYEGVGNPCPISHSGCSKCDGWVTSLWCSFLKKHMGAQNFFMYYLVWARDCFFIYGYVLPLL